MAKKASRSRDVRRVYLMTDLEGCAGVDDWDPRHADYVNTARYVYERAEMQRLLTAEVNACVEGCVDAGVDEVIVNDAHGAGRTILIEELHPKALLFRGKMRPYWLIGLDRCDAIFHVGMHAISDTTAGTLSHTMSKSVKHYRINGRPVSEFDISILIAGHHGIPAPFFSGERLACEQVKTLAPATVTVETKEGFSEQCAIHRMPSVVCAEIRERSAHAVDEVRKGKHAPVAWKGPFTLEIEMREPSYRPEDSGPGKTFNHSRSMSWRAADMVSVFNYAVYGKRPKAR